LSVVEDKTDSANRTHLRTPDFFRFRSARQPPPEPGFARREAHKRRNRWKHGGLGRLL